MKKLNKALLCVAVALLPLNTHAFSSAEFETVKDNPVSLSEYGRDAAVICKEYYEEESYFADDTVLTAGRGAAAACVTLTSLFSYYSSLGWVKEVLRYSPEEIAENRVARNVLFIQQTYSGLIAQLFIPGV